MSRRYRVALVVLSSLLWIPRVEAVAASPGSWYDDVGVDRGIRTERSASPYQSISPFELVTALPDASSACQISVLQNLGWTVERVSDTTRVNYSAGNPCDNSSLSESQSQGELRIRIPTVMNEAALAAALRQVLYSPATVCAYQFRLSAAAVRAARRLQANQNFYFYDGGFPYIQFTRADHWSGGCVTGGSYGCFYPRSSPSVSLEDFASGRIGTECALGLQAAEYGTLRELYGDSEFNRAFAPNEIVFAEWGILDGSTSATWGRLNSGDVVADPDASEVSKLGARAFSGFSGYLGNVFGETYLDNPIDRGENFMTFSVSLAAGAELGRRGGWSYFNRLNRRIYELGLSLSPEIEALALTRQNPDTLPISTAQRNAFREMQTILANPVYSGYQVYVHPLGIMSLGGHIVRLLERNPRTPYALQLYPSRMTRGLYQRYIRSLLSSCGS